MRQTMQQPLPPMEVNRVERPKGDAPNKVEDPELDRAKANFGAAVGVAIGTDNLKTYGDKGLMSNVVAGRAVPDYIGRIYQNDRARRRLGFALLRGDGDKGVKARLVIECDDWDGIGD